MTPLRLRSALVVVLCVAGAACGRGPDQAAQAPRAPTGSSAPAADSTPPPGSSGTPPADGIVSDSTDTPAAAAAVLRRYYEALGRRDYAAAYALWGDSGRSSGQTLEQFERGFANTDTTSAELGQPGAIDAAAGSRFVEIPVDIRARARSGAAQRFTGSYVLRRAVVDGATAEQRSWRIYTAHIRAAP